MMTAVGADSRSSTKYLRNIGDKEKTLDELKFDFLGLYRPSVILGNSNTPSALAVVMPLFQWAMPSRYHSIHKDDLARAMVAQSEQAFRALAHDNGPAAPVVKILEYKEMEPFFVVGGRLRAGCSLSEIVNQNDVAATVVLLRIREPPAIGRDSHNVADLPQRRAECPHLPSGEVEELKRIALLSALHEVNAVSGGHEVPL